MSIETGGPVFPQGISQGNNGLGYPIVENKGGATLRDYFTAKALQGLTANRFDICSGGREDICRFAYLYADQMIKERNKG